MPDCALMSAPIDRALSRSTESSVQTACCSSSTHSLTDSGCRDIFKVNRVIFPSTNSRRNRVSCENTSLLLVEALTTSTSRRFQGAAGLTAPRVHPACGTLLLTWKAAKCRRKTPQKGSFSAIWFALRWICRGGTASGPCVLCVCVCVYV